MGSKGLIILGNKHAIPSLLYIFDFKVDIFDWKFEMGLASFPNTGESFCPATSSFLPSCIIGLAHSGCWWDVPYADCLETVVAGSVKRTAVAGTVLDIINVPGRSDENTARTIAPLIPTTRNDTSAATTAL